MVNIGNYIYIYHTWMDCLGKRRFSLVLWFVSTVPLQWNGWEGQQTTTGARYLLFLGFAKGSVRYQLKLEISLVKTTPQTHWYLCLRSNFCATKIPLTHILSFINCLDSLVDPTPKHSGFFLGRIFPPGKNMPTSHILVGGPHETGPRPTHLSASARVAAALEESGGPSFQLDSFWGRKNPFDEDNLHPE